MTPQPRASLFVALSVVLIAAELFLGKRGSAPPQPPRPITSRAAPRHSHLSPVRPALTASARRFLVAFLRYEVGDRSHAVGRALRATAAPEFATELLRAPPRPPHRARPATLGPLAFATVSSDPPLVSVSGTAHRPTGPEQLSFVFELRHGRWLASAAGE